MQGLVDVLKYAYTAFVMRDLLGKILPGLVVLVATYWAWRPFDVCELQRAAQSLTFVEGSVLAGLGWTVGFAAQTLGCWMRISVSDPVPVPGLSWDWLWGERGVLPLDTEDKDARRERTTAENLVRDADLPESRKALRERQTIIIEACGNLASAMFWAAIVMVPACCFPEYGHWAAIGSLFLVFVMLWNRSLFQRRRANRISRAMASIPPWW